MRLIDPYTPLFTYQKIIKKYGGAYSFFGKLKIGGVGSPKVIYRSGIPEFDIIHYSDDLEKSMTNFELLKGGLIIRINKKQKLAVAIERLSILEKIVLIPRPIKQNGQSEKSGELIVKFKDQKPIQFEVGINEFDGIEKYFKKKVFAPFLNVSI